MYASARNTIESFNGYIKDGAHEALGDHTRRRLRGRTAQHFLTALLVMAANIRKIRVFMADLALAPHRSSVRLNVANVASVSRLRTTCRYSHVHRMTETPSLHSSTDAFT